MMMSDVRIDSANREQLLTGFNQACLFTPFYLFILQTNILS